MPHRGLLQSLAFCSLVLIALGRGDEAARGAEPVAEPTAADVEFFEKHVRPIFAQHCVSCHGAEKQKANLRIDTREAVAAGGDSGALFTPGQPDESLLMEVVSYTGDYKMPPKGKLPEGDIANLTEWVRRGAPWPATTVTATAAPSTEKAGDDFDLAGRRARQWALQPLTNPDVPAVTAPASEAANPIDRFILHRLQQAGLSPAPPAARHTLLRRLTFDLTGLPPTPAEIDAFVKDDRPEAYAAAVNRLLASPRYGERWARHWLDLVRYAETCGHEFDFDKAQAYEYRDYVIRALNADVPYSQFVLEHLAGDLLPEPRRDPATGINESIIGTGFFLLGEGKHSPVDIRVDEAERIDNQIDVFGKAFLAMTLACARCHDHKFDAISNRDYYAIAGFLQSSRPQIACIDPPQHNANLARQVDAASDQWRGLVCRADSAQIDGWARSFDQILQATAEQAAGERARESSNTARSDEAASDAVVFADFEGPTYGEWVAEGTAFGAMPNHVPAPENQGFLGQRGKGFVSTYSARDAQGKRVVGDQLTGTLTSPEFTIERPFITFLIGGGNYAGRTCLDLLVDGKVVRSATGHKSNQMHADAFDVGEFKGQRARLRIVDKETGGWGQIGIDYICFTRELPPENPREAALAARAGIKGSELDAWSTLLSGPALNDLAHPLHAWAAWLRWRGSHAPAGDPQGFLAERRRQIEATIAGAPPHTVWEDFSAPAFDRWFPTGEAFGDRPSTLLEVALGTPTSPALRQFWGAGVAYSGGRAQRFEGTLRSPTFTLEKNYLHYHLAGKQAKVNLIIDGFQLIRYPIYGGLTIAVDQGGELKWFAQDVSKWVGHRAYIELLDEGAGYLACDQIVFGDDAKSPVDCAGLEHQRLTLTAIETAAAGGSDAERAGDASDGARFEAALRRVLVERARQAVTAAVEAKDSQIKTAGTQVPGVEVADAAGGAHLAAKPSSPTAVDRLSAAWLSLDLPGGPAQWLRTVGDKSETLSSLEKRLRDLEPQIRYQRKAMALTDGSGIDEHVFLRGNPKKLGEVVPRRLMTCLDGEEVGGLVPGSGRLLMARHMVDPARNPLVPRVLVNRIWKHHFGEGLVATCDDFGNMGQAPTHPELLDWLSQEFIRHGWSMKHLHRLIVTSRTYQMSSRPDDHQAEEHDPRNTLLHRMPLRRLEAEVMRDTLLCISGRLDDRMFGPSVLPHLNEFMVGRGRPASGPLDGDGRRSIYISVRRNFLTPMFLAFDYPLPTTTIGRRSVSNVPSQALALMNNPFVLQQAELWGRRLSERSGTDADLVQVMYVSAFGRPAEPDEVRAACAFLSEAGGGSAANRPRALASLAHVLFNVKEFIFID